MASLAPPGELVETMVAGAKGAFATDWPKARDYAGPEFARLAQAVRDIAALHAAGRISDLEARSLFEIHRNTTRVVFLTVEGLGLIAVENAINAAVGAARAAVNTALGFPLL